MQPAIIIMGVAGAGKTTIGKALAAYLDCPFIEGDDYHPLDNRLKMAGGVPLTDSDRHPWLCKLAAELGGAKSDAPIVLACSALKDAYRSILKHCGREVNFIFLNGSRELIFKRVGERQGHFFPATLLDSQLAALEFPHEALAIDISLSVDAIVRRIAIHIGR
jgi:gluconokinase